jgi:hypothetical protein
MRRSSFLLALIAALPLAGCDPGVNGHWCGKDADDENECDGDEVFYAELDRHDDEPTVSGQFCEAFEKDCYDVGGGRIEGNVLTFKYYFGGHSVTGTFKLEDDELAGGLHSSKCDDDPEAEPGSCDIPVTLHRL